MSINLVVIAVFLAILAPLIVIMTYVFRSRDRLRPRLDRIREGREGAPARKSDGQRDTVSVAGDQLFALDPDSFGSLRARLYHAGYHGRHAIGRFHTIRIVLAAGAGLLSLQMCMALQLEGALIVLAVGGAALGGFMAPGFWVNHRVGKRRQTIRRAIPNVLDLIIVCVEAGLGLNAAIQRIAKEMKTTYPELAGELGILNQEIFVGISRSEAFRNLARRTGVDELRSLATVLMQADRMGTGVAHLLRVQADTLRIRRRQAALEAAHKMPVKLVFPLVLFIFPEILVVLLGPGGIQLFRTLSDVAR